MKKIERHCELCGAPLSRRRWWHIVQSPPLCPPGPMAEACQRTLLKRLGVEG